MGNKNKPWTHSTPLNSNYETIVDLCRIFSDTTQNPSGFEVEDRLIELFSDSMLL